MHAGLGLALTAALAVAMLAIPPLSARFTHQPFSLAWPAEGGAIPVARNHGLLPVRRAAGSAGERKLAPRIDGCVTVRNRRADRVRQPPAVVPVSGGYDASVAGVVACVVLSVGFFASALAAFERREF